MDNQKKLSTALIVACGLLLGCVNISDEDLKTLNSMKAPVIVVSTNRGAGFDQKTLLVRDSVGRIAQIKGFIFNSLEKGDTLK